MIRYAGRIYFGLAGDSDVLSDLDDLDAAIRESRSENPPVTGESPRQEGEKPAPNRGQDKPGADLGVG